jgi:hypothetical protein
MHSQKPLLRFSLKSIAATPKRSLQYRFAKQMFYAVHFSTYCLTFNLFGPSWFINLDRNGENTSVMKFVSLQFFPFFLLLSYVSILCFLSFQAHLACFSFKVTENFNPVINARNIYDYIKKYIFSGDVNTSCKMH